MAGILLRVFHRFPESAPSVLNGFILYLSLPALIFHQIHQAKLDSTAIYPALMPWILFCMSLFVFLAVGKSFQLDRKTVGTLILMGGLGNTSFVGYPVLEALYGREALKTGVLVDQLGSFPVFYTMGLFVSSTAAAQSFSWRKIFQKISSFPPLYALILSLLLKPLHFSDAWMECLEKLGSTLTPIAIVSVGFQLEFNRKDFNSLIPLISVVLLLKLLIFPLLIMIFYVKIFKVTGLAADAIIIEACMAPMISAAILTTEYQLNTKLANLVVGLGIPISLVSAPIWSYFLK